MRAKEFTIPRKTESNAYRTDGTRGSHKWADGQCGRVGTRTPCALLALILMIPLATAAQSSGEFVATGNLRVPAGATQEALARGAYARASSGEGFLSVDLQADRVKVHQLEETFLEVRTGVVNPNPSIAYKPENYTLTNVRLTQVAGDHRGWVGFYFPPEGARLGLASVGPATVEARAGLRLDDGAAPGGESERPDPSSTGYDWASEDLLLLVEGEGTLRYEGRGALKVMGPDVRIESDQGTIEFRTGQHRPDPDAPAGNRTVRWMLLEYENATVTVASPDPFKVAAMRTDVAWSGTVTFTPIAGRLHAAGDAYQATGRPDHVRGDLVAQVEPVRQDGQVRLAVRMDGDLVGTTMTRTEGRAGLPLGVQPAGWGWVLGLVATLGLALLVAGAVLVARRARGAGVSPEDRLALAHLAADRERYREALEHVRAARAAAPGSVRLLLEEASYLAEMSRAEEALALYEQAARQSPDGDAEFAAGLLLLQRGELERAEAFLVKALRRSPILVLEILYDTTGTFEPVRGRPAFERAVDAAEGAIDGR